MSNTIVTQTLFGRKEQITVGEMYQWIKSGKLACDPDFLQRLFNDSEWDSDRTNSYLASLFNSGGAATPFLIVELHPTIARFKDRLGVSGKKNKKLLQEIIDRLVSFTQPDVENGREIGADYLLLDGQHRGYKTKQFIEGAFTFNPPTKIETRFENENGTSSFEGNFLEDLKEYQQELFLNLPLDCTFYSTSEWSDLTLTFVSINSGTHMTDHEKRIINYNPSNIRVISFCNKRRNDMEYFLSSFKSVPKIYKKIHKGDTYLVCEFLIWHKDQTYEFNGKELDEAFGPNPIEKWNFDEKDYELTEKVIDDLITACAEYENRGYKLKDFTISSIHNLIYTLSYLYDQSNMIVKNYAGKANSKKKLEAIYDIIDLGQFAKWFFDLEAKRLQEGYEEVGRDDKNKPVMDYNNRSFTAHNHDTNHKSKESFKGTGGSPYYFDCYARLRRLLADLEKDLRTLINSGIIREVEQRSSSDRKKIAKEQGLVPSDIIGKHLDHIVPISKGGKTSIQNTRWILAKENLYKSDKVGFLKR